MPRTLIRPRGADRERSLGWLAVWWIESFVVHGPGDVEGQPIVHGDEYTGFIVDCYSLDDEGGRLVDSSFISRPKGCNKSGLAAEIALFEALGPCRFDGWAKGGETFKYLGREYVYEPGEPMGRPVRYPVVRIMATEEGQTGNTYDMIYLNLTEGPLSQLKAYGLDAGKTRTLLPEGGEIVPSSSGAASKDGGKETFVVFDETHLYNTNALRSMYKTVSRNLVKRRKSAGTWYIETTTMYAPGEDSVAERTYEYAQAIAAGKTKRSRMLYDHRWGDIKDLRVEDDLRKAIIEAYGDALEWVSLEGVVDDILDIRRDESESRRYFLNALTEASNAWLSPELISMNVSDQILFPGEQITLGFDGALTKDSTALVGCRVSDGHLFTIALEECPDGPAAREWMVDTELIDARVRESFEQYEVVGFFADPPYWQEYIDEWEREFGEVLQIKANNRSPIKWWTKRDTQMSQALDRLKTALKLSTTSLADDPDMRRHFLNAREWNRRGGSVIGKETKNSPRKIDLAMAATLAFEARAHYLAENVGEEDSWIPIRIA